jgi:hypothetical protein
VRAGDAHVVRSPDTTGGHDGPTNPRAVPGARDAGRDHVRELLVSAPSGPSLCREVTVPERFPAIAALIVAALVVIASSAGITDPAIYAHETASWRVQGIGQDWIDLIVAVPWLTASAIATLRGSRRASLVLGGGLAYTAYSFVIYAFDVHFNQLFLVYCAILGLSVYGLVGLGLGLGSAELRGWFGDRAPRRVASVMMMASAVVFALMWLADDVPAMIRDEPPASLADVGLPTNAVHVLDLSLVLPALFASGVMLWRRRGAGYVLATIAMGFCVLMDLNIAGIVIAMQRSGLPADLTLACVFGVVAALAAALLGLLLRSMRSPPSTIDRS